MKKLKGILPQSMLFQVYKALVESHLRYADVVWESLTETKITALQRLQNRAFEIIQGSKIKDSLIRSTFSIDQLGTKNGYSNLDTIEKADAKKKTEFWHTKAFRTYVLIRVRL